jgi:predicted ATPase
MEMANLNLDAAKYCLQISAFIKAADLLRKGLSFLPDSKMWNEYYELKLQMMQLLSEVELIIGNFETCKTIAEYTIENARSKEDKVDSMVILTRVHFLEGRISQCIRVSNQSLEVLGIRMPYKYQVCRPC